MLPIARPEGHLLLGVAPDSRPPPEEFAELFSALAQVSRRVPNSSIQSVTLERLALATQHAQVFDFGEIGEPFLMEEAKLGGRLMGEGLLKPPYDQGIYWYTLTDMQTLPPTGVSKVRYATVFSHDADEYLIADFMLLDPVTAAAMREDIEAHNKGNVLRELRRGRHMFMCSGIAEIHARPDSRWEGRLLDRPGEAMDASVDSQFIGSLADGVAAMSMLLTTKGVGLRREVVPRKLNEKREKQGKRPYPAVTYVNTREYYEAVQLTARGGTHASPVPHFRRGHIRTYQDGKRVWVSSALVNCRSPEEALRRDHYEVVT